MRRRSERRRQQRTGGSERRGQLYLLTGLVLGILLGLVYAWVISPVEFIDTAPAALRPEYRDQYRNLIAQAYQADGDLGRARSRLELLGDERPATVLSDQAERLLAAGGSAAEAQALAHLAADLSGVTAGTALPQTPSLTPAETGLPSATPATEVETVPPGEAVFTPTPQPAATSTPAATFTPRAGAQQATSGPPFALSDRQEVCDPAKSGLLQVEVFDGDGEPVAGVRIDIAWSGGSDSFYTGLFSYVSPGYADYDLEPGTVYSLRAGDGGEEVRDVQAPQCQNSDGSSYTGGLALKFSQP
ncbi:MAG: hypothetical protein GYA17_20395 [Chloroflexi bacterium]|jgi:hypothetical protein|nr:hypothetical protein [Anaerolineaceae bacterium]NMB90726.1 hypothetical protein [Chloroflexota bacterium]